MYRHLESRRRRAVLITIGLMTAASAGTLRTLSVAEARGSESAGAQSRKAPARRPAAVPAKQQPDGKKIFATTCAACHQESGEGVEGTYPPLAGSEWVTGDDAKLVRIILHGLTGPVEVAGETYTGLMPPWGGTLTDPEVAAVATYIRGAWSNKAAPVAAAKVTSIRAATASRKTPWTAAELAQVAIPVRKE